jgi:2-methylisocitrate lyase-like PEP mutase family enzyme
MQRSLSPQETAMATDRPSIADKRRRFRQLHERGCFVLPNPWDVGSARWLQGLGFPALASTSAGLAWALGAAENGFGADAAEVAESVRLALATGIAGLSIEDSTGDAAAPLFAIDVAVTRLRAARAVIDAAGGEAMLVARAECFLVGRPDLGETIDRLRAYAAAGADVLYAPGLQTTEQMKAVVDAVAPKPVNVVVGSASPLTVADIAALGVRRVSIGGALARSAWAGFQQAAQALVEGRFDGFASATPSATLNAFFRADAQHR